MHVSLRFGLYNIIYKILSSGGTGGFMRRALLVEISFDRLLILRAVWIYPYN